MTMTLEINFSLRNEGRADSVVDELKKRVLPEGSTVLSHRRHIRINCQSPRGSGLMEEIRSVIKRLDV